MWDKYRPLFVALAIFPFGALAGFAMLLRADKEINSRHLADAMLTSGLLSVCVFLISQDRMGDGHLGYIAGMSVLAGFGANTILGGLIKAVDGTMKRFIGGGNDNQS